MARVWAQGPAAAAQAWAETLMGCHGGLAVVERLLLVVVTFRGVFEVVLGQRGPWSVVTSLGTAGGGTREEEGVCDVTHSSTEGMPPEVVPTLAVWGEGWYEEGWYEESGGEEGGSGDRE